MRTREQRERRQRQAMARRAIWVALAAVPTIHYERQMLPPWGLVSSEEPNILCRFCRYYDAPVGDSYCGSEYAYDGDGCQHPIDAISDCDYYGGGIAEEMETGGRADCWGFSPRWPLDMAADIVGCWLRGEAADVPAYRTQEAVVMLP